VIPRNTQLQYSVLHNHLG